METRTETSAGERPCAAAGTENGAASAMQGGTFYRAIILSQQDILSHADINDRNEVAFDTAGPLIGKFYDGNIVHDTGLGLTRALNDRGQVIGSANVPETGALHAYLWSLSTGLVHLDVLGPPPGESAPRGINNRGEVVGVTSVESGPGHAAFWNADGSVLDLGTLGGVYSEATAINDAGEVTGFAHDAAAVAQAFLWTEDDGMRAIGNPGGGSSMGIDINAAGEIAGIASDAFGPSKPFFWSRREGMTVIGAGGYATGLNDRGMVAGVETISGQDRAFA
jgi:probable HAF family extracellular repeat protein